MPNIILNIEIIGRRVREVLPLWNASLKTCRLTLDHGVAGVRVGATEPDLRALMAMFEQDGNTLGLRMERTVTVEYTSNERQAAEFLMIFPPTEYDCIRYQLKSFGSCPECGRDRPVRRSGSAHWIRGVSAPERLFSDEHGELVVHESVRELIDRSCKANVKFESIEGVRQYSICVPTDHLRRKESNQLVCSSCKVPLALPLDDLRLALEVYEKPSNGEIDVRTTDDYPHTLCLSRRVLSRFSSITGACWFDRAVPVFWDDPLRCEFGTSSKVSPEA